jgi:hypothetical protein
LPDLSLPFHQPFTLPGAPAVEEPGVEPEETRLIEQKIVEVWKEILEVETISPQDDFFTIGGHSLLAVQIIARIIEVFQDDLPEDTFEIEGVLLNEIFEKPVITALAERLAIICLEAKSSQTSPENDGRRIVGQL